QNRWVMLAVIFLTRTSMGFMFQSVASVAPFLIDQFTLSYGQIGLLMGLYLLPGALIALPSGVLGQRFGSRRVAVAGLALMTTGGLITAWSASFLGACVGRTVSGAGGILLNLPRRAWALSVTAGVCWSAFNASFIVVASFGPALLIAHGASVAEAGSVVSLAIWVTLVSVPLGGYAADRLRRPNLAITTGALAAALCIALLPLFPHPVLWLLLAGILVGLAPGAIMALLPEALEQEHLATGLGMLYTI